MAEKGNRRRFPAALKSVIEKAVTGSLIMLILAIVSFVILLALMQIV